MADWRADYDGKPLWKHAAEMRDRDMGWPKIAQKISKLTGEPPLSRGAVQSAVVRCEAGVAGR